MNAQEKIYHICLKICGSKIRDLPSDAERILKIVRENTLVNNKYQLTTAEEKKLKKIITESLEAIFYKVKGNHRHTELRGLFIRFFDSQVGLERAKEMHLDRKNMYYMGFSFYLTSDKLVMGLNTGPEMKIFTSKSFLDLFEQWEKAHLEEIKEQEQKAAEQKKNKRRGRKPKQQVARG